MSRSRRKTPHTGWTTAESEKWDKRMANRKHRREGKRLLEDAPDLRSVSNVFTFAKDGKQRFSPDDNPSLMRK